ncbi:MAG: class I SAM-dependent methyltransferase [Acidobacteriota bacterium]
MSPDVVSTYTSAADHFDNLPFWHHFGRRTVERLHLARGARVLDLCCGAGASAIPAGEAVGPEGRVTGIDITPALVDIARCKATARGLSNVDFTVGDVSGLDYPPGSVDAVISVFGWFFLDDMAGMLARAWTWLRPGGVIALTTWGTRVLAPGEDLFWETVEAEDPTISPASPSDRLKTPADLAALVADAGLPTPAIDVESWQMPLERPEDFWPVVLGTSNRGAIEALTPAARERVYAKVIGELRTRRIRALDLEAVFTEIRLNS